MRVAREPREKEKGEKKKEKKRIPAGMRLEATRVKEKKKRNLSSASRAFSIVVSPLVAGGK